MRSVNSVRTVRTKRSAKQFARGQRGGIFTTSIPASARTASNDAANCPARSRTRNRNRAARLVGLLGERLRAGRPPRPVGECADRVRLSVFASTRCRWLATGNGTPRRGPSPTRVMPTCCRDRAYRSRPSPPGRRWLGRGRGPEAGRAHASEPDLGPDPAPATAASGAARGLPRDRSPVPTTSVLGAAHALLVVGYDD